jgi:hypothetical protein
MLAAASSKGNWSSLCASELKYSSGVGADKFSSMSLFVMDPPRAVKGEARGAVISA